MLALSVAPGRGVHLRPRPEAFLGQAAAAHVRRWRAFEMAPAAGAGGAATAAAAAERCEAHATCASCRARKGAPAKGALQDTLQLGCAWCGYSGRCVADVAGVCASAADHHGDSGLGGTCESGAGDNSQ